MSFELGIYEDRGQLDHDVAMLMRDMVLSELGRREVGEREAMAAVRRWVRNPW
ncbi:hypothetical protein [Microbacterium sp.]|uniref:hypothetical protein n=1 Tax=Microbacterium sp. TaxID=51671 RepID=UPI0039E5A5E9